jgi:acyl carrier protein
MSREATEPEELTYAAAIDAIRLGVASVREPDAPSQEVTNSTAFWAGEDPDEPCLGFDSLDLLELVIFLEERFGWEIPEERIDAQGWRTVGDLAAVMVEIVPASPSRS